LSPTNQPVRDREAHGERDWPVQHLRNGIGWEYHGGDEEAAHASDGDDGRILFSSGRWLFTVVFAAPPANVVEEENAGEWREDGPEERMWIVTGAGIEGYPDADGDEHDQEEYRAEGDDEGKRGRHGLPTCPIGCRFFWSTYTDDGSS
jgi:hypothetical protein